jgi:hypothetical protein
MRRTSWYFVGWLAAVVVATIVGLLVVRTVGDTVRAGRPLGQDFDKAIEAAASPATSPSPATRVVEAELTGEYGIFQVSCQGPFARGISVSAAPGWKAVSFERGPEADVDASFIGSSQLIEVEAFCNAGIPQVAEIERTDLGAGTTG